MVSLLSPAFRLVLRGKIVSVQTWSISIWAAATPVSGTGYTQGQLNTLALDMDALAVAAWGTYAASINPDTNFAETGVYFYPFGSLVATQSAVSPARAASLGTGSGNLPVQTSCVVSLRTGVSGRTGRGRNYLPFNGTALTTGHQFSTTPITNAAIAYQTWLQAINAYSSVPSNVSSIVPCVASHVTGNLSPITQVTVDSDPDTQRRRSDKILAASQVSRTI